MSREWCGEIVEAEVAGSREDLRCTEDIVDGSHRTESHRAIIYWGSPDYFEGQVGRTWCDETIDVEINGVPDDARCTEDITDGRHRTENHQSIFYWGSPP